MQERQVQSLLQEDSTSHGAILWNVHLCHNWRAHALQQEKPLQGEAHTPQPESSSLSPQLEKARTATKTQHNQK